MLSIGKLIFRNRWGSIMINRKISLNNNTLFKKNNIKFFCDSLKSENISNDKTSDNKSSPPPDELNGKSDLEKMQFYNKKEQPQKVIDLFLTIPHVQRNKFHREQFEQAKKELQNQITKINEILFSSYKQKKSTFVRVLQAALIIFLLYLLYTHFFIPKDQSGEKKSGYLYKLFDPTHNFEISFAKDITERLDNVKGIDEVKEEIDQLIEMIRDPQKYLEAGAKLHKGILLCGKPGCGKTLIARAIAGEAGVNFIFITGSDFDEMFVGVGASRIRKLFKKAKEHGPCIIFIDEIDSLLAGSRRTMEHSSSRGTLNQFLAEMDGFNKLDEVYVIGATNHERDLDPAAVRPGRFDKTIHVNYPDENGRVDIIKFYLEKIKLEKINLDPRYLARLTPGFSGAELENLVNLSILHALNLDKNQVDMEDFFEARDRILMGIPRKKFSTTEKNRYYTSLHEAGHALVCYKNPLCRKTLHKVTIIPRGQALGVTAHLANEEALHTKLEFIAQIDSAMGGHVAEELIYGNDHVTAGCSSDLDKATKVAQGMVKNYGMYGDKVGYIYVEDQGYQWEDDVVSDKYKSQIDETVKTILNVKY
jgi:ATP-dependent metalloprotease